MSGLCLSTGCHDNRRDDQTDVLNETVPTEDVNNGGISTGPAAGVLSGQGRNIKGTQNEQGLNRSHVSAYEDDFLSACDGITERVKKCSLDLKETRECFQEGLEIAQKAMEVAQKAMKTAEEAVEIAQQGMEIVQKGMDKKENLEEELVEIVLENTKFLKEEYRHALDTNKQKWKEEISHLLSPNYYQKKIEGITDEGMKSETEKKITRFFHEGYENIVGSDRDDYKTDEMLATTWQNWYDSIKVAIVCAVCGQIKDLFIHVKDKESLEEEERLKDVSHAYSQLLYCYSRQNPKFKKSEISMTDAMNAVCEQIYELFTYYQDKLSSSEEERLKDISHAYGLLLYHYRKQDLNFEKVMPCPVDQNPMLHNLFLSMVTVSPPFVLFIPKSWHKTSPAIMEEYALCNTKKRKEPHSFHVRIPIIFKNYLGELCECGQGLVCKGLT